MELRLAAFGPPELRYEFTYVYSDFPCHLKVNTEKIVLTINDCVTFTRDIYAAEKNLVRRP